MVQFRAKNNMTIKLVGIKVYMWKIDCFFSWKMENILNCIWEKIDIFDDIVKAFIYIYIYLSVLSE